MLDKDRSAVFVVGRISQEQYREIRFGDEGQEFKLMPVEDFIKSRRCYSPSCRNALKTIYQKKEEK